ncbi:MAG: hypothetical protein CTY15_08965 [Methylocystis sp.]|nr:MAG: hypothetical protein CTY15_08965 [Methylocystis sp.]
MRITSLTIGALFAFGVCSALGQTSGLRLANKLDWKPSPAALPRGAEVAVLFGDPQASGPFVVRLRAPAGYQVPAHKHPDLETVTVISGVLRLGQGQRIDPATETYLHAGDFLYAMPGMGHWIAVNEDAVLQVTGTGPWQVDYFDPRDKPRSRARRAGDGRGRLPRVPRLGQDNRPADRNADRRALPPLRRRRPHHQGHRRRLILSQTLSIGLSDWRLNK